MLPPRNEGVWKPKYTHELATKKKQQITLLRIKLSGFTLDDEV